MNFGQNQQTETTKETENAEITQDIVKNKKFHIFCIYLLQKPQYVV